ncbi:MAG: anti-sigma factor [Chloroflexi bacterium]|nr:anti-sigma factor [Chloroflexota bacterium]
MTRGGSGHFDGGRFAPRDGAGHQVLLIRDDGHDTAETFTVSTEGNGVLVVHSAEPLNTFTAVGVSIEPAGGSIQRTGEIVLLGNLMTN